MALENILSGGGRRSDVFLGPQAGWGLSRETEPLCVCVCVNVCVCERERKIQFKQLVHVFVGAPVSPSPSRLETREELMLQLGLWRLLQAKAPFSSGPVTGLRPSTDCNSQIPRWR